MKNEKLQKPTLNELEFIPADELPDFLDVEASLQMNPYVRWAKFIMTDDQPNGNNERTPLSEFDNIIQSGIHMPIKMAEGKIEDGHENASPIGVITHLKKQVVDIAGKAVNQIVGLAAFWLKERPSDVSFLKQLFDNGKEPNLSWELGAQDRVLASDGVYDWKGLAVQATTIVNKPAYQGRTRIIAMASKNVDNLPDSSFLYVSDDGSRLFPVKDDKGLYVEGKLRASLEEMDKSDLPTEILEPLKATVATLLARIEGGASLEEISAVGSIPLENKFTEDNTVELEEAKKRVAELEAELAAAKASLQEAESAKASLNTEKASMETELAELRAFKKEIDDEVAKAEKLDGIKTKFAEAKLEKSEAYFTENSEKLLGLDEAALDFMIQELAAFSAQASQKQEVADEDKKVEVPNFTNSDGEIDIHAIVAGLKELKSK